VVAFKLWKLLVIIVFLFIDIFMYMMDNLLKMFMILDIYKMMNYYNILSFDYYHKMYGHQLYLLLQNCLIILFYFLL